MARLEKEMCMTCRFWFRLEPSFQDPPDVESIGECRVMPPVRNSHSGEGQWPVTEESKWCGEFEDEAMYDLGDENALGCETGDDT